jgi:flagellar motility protein MotE (MotC chaperone)
MLDVPLPRLLPTTITVLAIVFALKCALLVQRAVTDDPNPALAVLAVASAAGAEHIKEAPKPVPAGAPAAPQGKGQGKDRPKAEGEAAEAKPDPAKAAPAAEGPPPVSESEKALLQELRQRRKELEAKADAIAAREAVLAAAEQKLGTRVSELQALQKRLEGLDAAQKQKEDAGWQGLVKLYEAMKPKDAATIFNELAMPVLLQVLDRMKDVKAAAVLAAMSPDKARDVTAELAQLRTGRDPASGLRTAGG